MIQEVIFRQPAVEDVAEAAAWYEAHAPGLGEQLIEEILLATRRAQNNPELFRLVHRDGEVRRVLTNRFPYRIFFSVVRENTLRSRRPPRCSPRSSMDGTIVNTTISQRLVTGHLSLFSPFEESAAASRRSTT
jgi:plasmid stabilization system protein ParE